MFSTYSPRLSQSPSNKENSSTHQQQHSHQPYQSPHSFASYPYSHIHAVQEKSSHIGGITAPYSSTTIRSPNPSNRVGRIPRRSTTLPPQRVLVRPQQGPVTHQLRGHGPYHAVKEDKKRFNFSIKRKPGDTGLGNGEEGGTIDSTISLIDTSPSAEAQVQSDPIRFQNHVYPQNLQSLYNDPLSSYQDIKLERFSTHLLTSHSGSILEGNIQPALSAQYITSQTSLRLASKQQHLEEYHRAVQERLNKRVHEEKRKEEQRKKMLPKRVQKLVYQRDVSSTPSETGSRDGDAHGVQFSPFAEEEDDEMERKYGSLPQPQQQQQQPSHQTLDEFLAESTPQKHHLHQQHGSESAMSASVDDDNISRIVNMSTMTGAVEPRAAAAPLASSSSTAAPKRKSLNHHKPNAHMSKSEHLSYLRQVRREESERSRMKARQARESGRLEGNGDMLDDSRRQQQHPAFGSMYPRYSIVERIGGLASQQQQHDILSGAPSSTSATPRKSHQPHHIVSQQARGDDRDLYPLAQRNPHAFGVRKTRESDEERMEKEKIVLVPTTVKSSVKGSRRGTGGARSVDGDLTDRTTGSNKSEKRASTAADKHSAYRRFVLERLHAVSSILGVQLPPLCACGFTPRDEYELLFAYGGSGNAASATAPTAASSQHLSTFDSVLHTHASHHAGTRIEHLLASHVGLETSNAGAPAPGGSQRAVGFAHKQNCEFHGQPPEVYVKAMAALLHTLEDQQQM